jgi:hypothetical protein
VQNKAVGKGITDADASKVMIAAGFKPLVPYETSSTPWKSRCIKCKREVSPTFNNVKSKGVTCQYCAGNAVHIDDVMKIFKAAKLIPLEEFPGAKKPWKCKCKVCGEIVSPTFSSVKSGGGCKFCARKHVGNISRIKESDAILIMRDAGLKPLEPYSGSDKPWKCKCLKCKRIVTPRLSMVKSKQSGCAYCAGVRVDEQEALKVLKRNKLKPLEPYTGNKHPWKCIHIPCGKTVSPRYNSLQRGQGPCKYCAQTAVDPDDAVTLFLSRELKPIEPYSGNSKKPWRSIHIPCGNEVSPTYNIIQRDESIGCKFCSDQFVDPDEAFQFMLSKEFNPLIPYPGSNKPWKSLHLKCGSEVRPSYGKIKSGRIGCPVCSGNLKITQERAFGFFRSKHLEPLEPFQGPNKPWKSIHTECGKEVSPRWASVQQGQNGCKYCAGTAVDEKDAIALFVKLGIKTLEPFPGGTKPWKSIHIKCGREVSPTYSNLRAGHGPCRYCAGTFVDASEAINLYRSRGLEPLTQYPGSSTGWRSRHMVCGKEVSPSYGYIKMGGVGCKYCAGLAPISPAAAKKLFISRGFKPLELFVNTKTPVRAIHKVCGREVKPTYGALRDGGGCKYCSIGGINLSQPGFLYLMTHKSLGAHKIGIGGFASSVNRIEQHKKHEWELFKSLDFETAELAYEIEQFIINWIRNDLGLLQYLVIEQMPQGGHTETIDASEIDLSTIWAKVEELSKVKK